LRYIKILYEKLPAISNNYGVTLKKIRFIVTATHETTLEGHTFWVSNIMFSNKHIFPKKYTKLNFNLKLLKINVF